MVIGSGSVVTKNIPSHVIAAGVPCRVIREITDTDLDTESESKKTSDSAIAPEQIVEILANPEVRDLLIKLAGMLKENEQMGSEL